MRRPCNDCPWRKDAPAGYWHPDHFRDIYRSCQDDGFHTMLCHKSAQLPQGAKKLACQGWVRVMGFEAVGVRTAVSFGHVTVEEVEDRSGPELYATFDEMLEANDIERPERNVFVKSKTD